MTNQHKRIVELDEEDLQELDNWKTMAQVHGTKISKKTALKIFGKLVYIQSMKEFTD